MFNRIDPRIHNGKPIGVMSSLLNLFRQPGDVATVPEMLKPIEPSRQNCLNCKKAGTKSLFEKATFEDLQLAGLVESQKLISGRKS
jgi:hypothetical protein